MISGNPEYIKIIDSTNIEDTPTNKPKYIIDHSDNIIKNEKKEGDRYD